MRISQVATGGTGAGVELGDSVVYLSDGPAGLSVIDVSAAFPIKSPCPALLTPPSSRTPRQDLTAFSMNP